MRRALATVLMGATFAACGVNEMPTYRDRIHEVRVEAALEAPPELLVATPAPPAGPLTPAEAAQQATEAWIVDGLADRLGAQVSAAHVRGAVADAFSLEASERLGWAAAPTVPGQDARFLVAVDRLLVEVDVEGRPEVQVELTVSGWYVPEDRVIYRRWSRVRLPLLDASELASAWGDDPAELAAVRAENLMRLHDLPAPVLRGRVLAVAMEGTERAVDELVRLTYE